MFHQILSTLNQQSERRAESVKNNSSMRIGSLPDVSKSHTTDIRKIDTACQRPTDIEADRHGCQSDRCTAILSSDRCTAILSSDRCTAILSSDHSTTVLSADPSTTMLSSDPSTTIFSADPYTTMLCSDPSTTVLPKD